MGFIGDLKQRLKAYREMGYDPVFVSREQRAKRMEICRACPEFLPASQRCKICGCFMPLKSTLEYDPVETALKKKIVHTHCPLDKW